MKLRSALLPLSSAVALLGGAAAARDSLGIFGDWGTFRDIAAGRCYAIAKAQPEPRQRERQAYMTVTSQAKPRLQGQLYWRLGRTPSATSPIGARIGRQYFRLSVNGYNAWAQDARMEMSMRAAIREAAQLSVVYRDSKGRRFSDKYRLSGAPTAMDAAALACSRDT